MFRISKFIYYYSVSFFFRNYARHPVPPFEKHRVGWLKGFLNPEFIMNFITEGCDKKDHCKFHPFTILTMTFKTSIRQYFQKIPIPFPELQDIFHSWFDLPYAVWCSWCDRVSVSWFRSLPCLVLWCAWSDVTSRSLITPCFLMWCDGCAHVRLIMSYPPSHYFPNISHTTVSIF